MEKEKKLQIIRAAVKRFAKHGINKTTLDEIARDLRIGKASIYHYFTSKDELFFDTVRWEANQIIEDIKTIFNNEQVSIKERFTEYFTYKESVPQKYRLIYNAMVNLFREAAFDIEKEILKELLQTEEEIIKLVFSSVYSKKLESLNPALPAYIVNKSWGNLFGVSLLNSLITEGYSAAEFILKDIEPLFEES